MTKQLENVFDLPSMDSIDAQALAQEFQSLEKIDQQVPTITDLSSSDAEMDELATKAMDSFDNLVSLGMNVEQRFAAPIFDAASKMLGHAVMAKTAKIDKKLKAIDLEMKRLRLMHQIGNKDPDGGEPIEGAARELDRNELLKLLKGE
jgi:hypothetical protein